MSDNATENPSEYEILQQKYNSLQKEIIEMKNQVLKVNCIKEVLPPHYEEDMQRLRQLETRTKKLQKIVDLGNISGLQTLIEQYVLFSRTQLKKISLEMQFSEYGDVESKSIEEFVEYLDHIRSELHNLILFQEKNLRNPLLNQCDEEMAGIVNELLNKTNFIKLSNKRLNELFFTLQTFRHIIDEFKEEPEIHE